MWELPTKQFLNDLMYLKFKRKVDEELERQVMKKYSNGKK